MKIYKNNRCCGNCIWLDLEDVASPFAWCCQKDKAVNCFDKACHSYVLDEDLVKNE